MLLELDWQVKHEAIRFFLPHGGQEEFIADIARPGGFIVISGAGNSWGKSELLVAVLTAFMWPDMASAAFTKHDIFKNNNLPKRARIYSTPNELEDVGSIQSAINKYFPTGRYTESKGSRNYRAKLFSDTGWAVDLFSYERGEAEVAGPNIGVQIFNEPPPEEIWEEAIYRARPGLIIGGMTSLYTNPWVVSGIFDKHNAKDVRIRYGSAEENCIEHGKNGNVPHEVLERMWSQSDPDQLEARKTGRPLSFSGRIFKSFSRDVHVSPERPIPSDGAIYQVIDPAIGKPVASVWAHVGSDKCVHVFREYPDTDFHGAKDSGLTVKEYADMFRNLEAGRPVQTRIIDRHFGNVRRTLGGLTLKQEFSEFGIDFFDSYMVGPEEQEVETGIMKVKEFLRYDAKKPIDGLNRPRLTVSESCRNTIAALEKWSRNPKTGKPLEEFKDFADCIRYLVMSEPSIETTREWGVQSRGAYGVTG